MTTTYPKFTDHPDWSLRFIEFHALKILVYDKKTSAVCEAHPVIAKGWMFWLDHYTEKAKPKHEELMRAVQSGGIASIDEFYLQTKKLFKPTPRGKALKDKKKRTGQTAFQRKKLGDAFIENKDLISAAKACALELADQEADKETILLNAQVLAELYAWNDPLSEEQLSTLVGLITAEVAKHLRLDRIEAKILNQEDKNLYYMYGQIKKSVPVGNTIELGLKSAAELGKCSRSHVKPILTKLEKLGFIHCIQTGKQGSSIGRAAIYRREA